MRKFSILLLGILILTGSVLSQIDPNAQKITQPLPMRLILPLAYNQTPGPLDMLLPPLANGVFDYYQVSGTAGFCETDIAAAPWNPNIFVATDNRITGFVGTPWIYYTTDAGVTWGQANVSGNQGDPVFSADSLGNFYMAVLNSGVQVYKSTNNGQSWFSLGLATPSNPQADKEWIAADPTNGPYKNHVYVAYVNFQTGAQVDLHRSTNNGQSWQPAGLSLGTGTPNPGPNLIVGNDGRVFLSWYNGAGTTLKYSSDGGASLSANISASAHSTPGIVNPTSGRPSLKGDIRVNGNSNLAVDRSNGPYRGYIYNLYATNPPGPDLADIFLTRSTDNGLTWNVFAPIRANDDATTNDQWMPDVSVDRQGRIWAFWYDSRNDASNILTEVFAAVSTDGGQSFSPNFRIAPQFNPNIVKIAQGAGHYYMGDYQGMSGESNVTFPFTMGMNNNRNNYIAYLPDYGVDFNKTIDSINPGSTSQVRVRIPTFGPLYGTITYSASINPSPAPGTVTFNWIPGNVKVMNGTADSILLHTNLSIGTPQTLYTVTVTGTQTGGPRTHTRTFQIRVGSFVGLEKNTETVNEFRIEQNYPNPFNPETNIKFSLPVSADVSLKIYDILGNEVAVLVNEKLEGGSYTAKLDGSKLSSGIYFYRIEAGQFTETKKMLLVK